MITLSQKVFQQASWLAVFKLITQIFSWASTIVIARILVPGDYGLMEMATVFTGYAALFSELGFGAAVIQRRNPTEKELSSVFWFTFILSIIFALFCFVFAYFTALIFNEPGVIPLTKAVSIIFILNGLMIVPFNLMKKELNFKKIGFIEMASALVSCVFMLFIAYAGGGAWTLLTGHIIRSFIKLVLIFRVQRWRPAFYLRLHDIKSYLNFGILIALARTFRYLFEKSDQFFAAIAWSTGTLGFYSFAMFLAKIPTEKIVSLVMQVSYSAFSELQQDKESFNRFYLNTNKIIAMLVLPLFAGGYIAGEELIKVLLDEKWVPIIFIFKMLCISQIFLAITAINNHVHNAQGRPLWSMYYNGICAGVMSVSFYFAVQHGLKAILIPWLTLFPLLCTCFIIITLIKIDISIVKYLKTISLPMLATLVMILVIVLFKKAISNNSCCNITTWEILCIEIILGGLSYIGFLLVFDRKFLKLSCKILFKK